MSPVNIKRAPPRRSSETDSKRETEEDRTTNDSVTVRMYNVGFGDCFLVTLRSGTRRHQVLFDCGTIASGPSPIGTVVGQILADVTEPGSTPKIDVIVATHRHRDHVSGFAEKAWSQVEVGEVWMPWTESPSDPHATRIRNAQQKLSHSLAVALSSPTLDVVGLSQLDGELPARENALQDLVLNALSNKAAMDTLHKGFASKPARRFLPELNEEPKSKKKCPYVRSFTTPFLPEVLVHVLGPSRDEDTIRELNPPKGESYLRSRYQQSQDEPALCKPFGDEHVLVSNDAPRLEYADVSRIDAVGRGPETDVAVALDKAINGTSLMLVLEFRGVFLLFPGDVQWGTWKSVLADSEWRKLLGKATFLQGRTPRKSQRHPQELRGIGNGGRDHRHGLDDGAPPMASDSKDGIDVCSGPSRSLPGEK